MLREERLVGLQVVLELLLLFKQSLERNAAHSGRGIFAEKLNSPAGRNLLLQAQHIDLVRLQLVQQPLLRQRDR